ncbi:MAG: hypothetical protein L6276_14325 [Acetobacterium sp.]|nr:hypothetical protein [Bacillota bacterium]MCG2731434.1 hypothetical protein [Acetobacterium sp.]
MKKRLFLCVMIVFMLVGLSGCRTTVASQSPANPLVGKWEATNSFMGYENYEFTSDNQVIHEICSNGTWTKSTYDYQASGNSLFLTNGQYYLGDQFSQVLEDKDAFAYQIDGDQLTLYNKFTFNRVDQFTNAYGEAVKK